jgi:hypothetical protein
MLSSVPLPRLRVVAACVSIALALSAGGRAASQPASLPAPPFEQIRKIDVHSHVYEDLPAVNAMLRRANVRIVNVSNPGTDGHLAFMHRFNAELAKKHPDIFSWASTFDLTSRHEPGYVERVTAALDETFAQGAVMTKIWKEVGLELKRPDGTFMLPDDPVLDGVYAHLAKRRKPLLAHLAEPLEAWLPLDPKGLHFGYYSRNPEWHLFGKPEYPSHQGSWTPVTASSPSIPGSSSSARTSAASSTTSRRSRAGWIAIRTSSSRCPRARGT